MSRGRTRREALAAAGGLAALALTGCGDDPPPGSTLTRTLTDPDGDGFLAGGSGLPLRDRRELGGGGPPLRSLAALAQLSDPHVRDAQSPARVPFLDRLGAGVGSAFRPHETLTAHVLAATVRSVNAWDEVGAVLVTGDLIDSAQGNELEWALGILGGGRVTAGSGAPRYEGVQAADNPDPLYYRPDVDAPRHEGLLGRALAPLRSPGLRAPWWPLLGNHDVLVQGELSSDPVIASVATGRRLTVSTEPELLRNARDARLDREAIHTLMRAAAPLGSITVSADPRRAHPRAQEIIARLASAAPAGLSPARERLDFRVDLGERLAVIALDLARRDAGGDGLVTADTLDFLLGELATLGERYVIVASHQPLPASAGGAAVLGVLDRDPRVVALVAGHTHRNEITPRRSPSGGYWLVTTASIVDYPQQWRALRLVETSGGVALETWLVDHGGRPGDEGDLAGVARELAFLDPQGGRPAAAMGRASARNVRLHLPRRRLRAPRRRPSRPALPEAPPPSIQGAGDGLG